MASDLGPNGAIASNHENFAKFFESWLSEQDRDLQDLRTAAGETRPQSSAEAEAEDCRLRRLVDRVIGHYEHYYRTKSASAKRDVLPMFNPKWTSSTENLLLWAGGWRPSAAFHLLYSKSGLQLESQLLDLIRHVDTRDLADLSPEQLDRIDRLQQRTIRIEREISEEEAAAQEKVASSSMVDLVHAITETRGADDGSTGERMEPEMRSVREGMEAVLGRADGLRMETLRGIVEILRPTQAVHFLIAAAELHLQVHEFGVRKDAAVAAAAARGTH